MQRLTDLAADAFVGRGYSTVLRRQTTAGSEYDLLLYDPDEDRQAVVECKATKDRAGTPQVNKLLGAMQALRAGTVGYFVSLAGYTAQALEQQRRRADLANSEAAEERERRHQRANAVDQFGRRVVPTPAPPQRAELRLYDGHDLAQLAINSRIVVPVEVVADAAARWAGDRARAGVPRLLGHSSGWLWLVIFDGAYCLVGADGHVLDVDAAEEIGTSDPVLADELRGLSILGPRDSKVGEEALRELVLATVGEAAQITFEGLPADAHAVAAEPQLHDLFVALDLWPDRDLGEEESDTARLGVGAALNAHRCLALLGHPGAGKSTLLRWLAVHYATAALGTELTRFTVDHGRMALPTHDWLPLLIRCRELPTDTGGSVVDRLARYAERLGVAEHPSDVSAALSARLREGRLLLLVDGLDEIADESVRVGFARQLRRLTAQYRRATIVITARHAGFEAVAPLVAGVAARYRVADLSEAAVANLIRRWRTTVDRTEDKDERRVREVLGQVRLRRLARNPLLLTTLLLVRRWLGRLPQNRGALYGKAMEVLLMSWNAEAWEPIAPDEALPQLAFAAWGMTSLGDSEVTRTWLLDRFSAARRELPHILGYPTESVSRFIDRVELRSSLLIRTGKKLVDGRLDELYEFRHLTFQEYLTAYGLVHGYYSGAATHRSLAERLEAVLDDPRWAEVYSACSRTRWPTDNLAPRPAPNFVLGPHT